MNCSEVQQRLSAYFDGELSPDWESRVATHLDECSECSAQLADFDRLANLAAKLSTLEPSPQVWAAVERNMDRPVEAPPDRNSSWRTAWIAAASLAAMLFIGVAVWWTVAGHDHAAEFAQYLETFEHDPVAAERFLVSAYPAQSIQLKEAQSSLTYLPVVAQRGLPPKYSLQQAYVIEMPCCKCLLASYCAEGGHNISVFEHDEDQPEWFEDRPRVSAHCCGQSIAIIELNEKLAVTWQQGQQHITIVGIPTLEEVNQLVEHLATPRPNGGQGSPASTDRSSAILVPCRSGCACCLNVRAQEGLLQ